MIILKVPKRSPNLATQPSLGAAGDRKRKILQLAIMLSIGCVIGLVSAEILVRVFFPQGQTPLLGWVTYSGVAPGMIVSDPEMGWRLKPGFDGQHVRGSHVKINSLGLRDREYDIKGESELRVLSFGDSFAFGYGVDIKEAYGKILENLLRDRFRTAEISVVNAGVDGYGTQQIRLQFDRLVRTIDPDFVLITFFSGNDVWENAVFERRLRQHLNVPTGFLGRHSHLVRLFLRATFGPRFFVSNRSADNMQYTWHLFEEFDQRLQEMDLPYLIVIIPARHQVRPSVHPGSKLVKRLGLDSYLLRQNRFMIDSFIDARVPFVDLYPVLAARDQEEPVYFEKDPHTNAVGHRLIAETIIEHIEPELASLPGIRDSKGPK